MHYTPLSFRWEPEFVARVDAARGREPRSAFVRRAVERALEAGEAREPVSAGRFSGVELPPPAGNVNGHAINCKCAVCR